MTPSKNILNRPVSKLEINDVILTPTWARGTVREVTLFEQEKTGAPAIRVRREREEDIIFLPSYVVTIERAVVPTFPALSEVES